MAGRSLPCWHNIPLSSWAVTPCGSGKGQSDGEVLPTLAARAGAGLRSLLLREQRGRVPVLSSPPALQSHSAAAAPQP